MKLDRLRKTLEAQGGSKIFVRTDAFCLCARVSAPQPTDAGLSVQVRASVRVSLPSMKLTEESADSGTLHLIDAHRVTRRVQTHRRHLEDLEIPEPYFRLAQEL